REKRGRVAEYDDWPRSNERTGRHSQTEGGLMRLERVVIATDFSERSIAAAQWVARSFVPKAELMLVHVLESPPPPHFLRRRSPRRADGSDALRTGARERLRQIRRQLGKGLISEQLREGRAHEEVLRAASEFAADLIVVGSHRDKPG